MNGYPCPVCAYDRSVPAEEFDICECCGTEYGVDDFSLTGEGARFLHSQLRWQWLERGAPWFDPGTQPPPGWNGLEQAALLAVRPSSWDMAGANAVEVQLTWSTRGLPRVMQDAAA